MSLCLRILKYQREWCFLILILNPKISSVILILFLCQTSGWNGSIQGLCCLREQVILYLEAAWVLKCWMKFSLSPCSTPRLWCGRGINIVWLMTRYFVIVRLLWIMWNEKSINEYICTCVLHILQGEDNDIHVQTMLPLSQDIFFFRVEFQSFFRILITQKNC